MTNVSKSEAAPTGDGFVVELDAERALALLRAAVAGREDYVYQRVPLSDDAYDDYGDYGPDPDELGCRYEYGGAPCCLIGHVLKHAGATIAQLGDLDADGGVPITDAPQRARWLQLTPDAAHVLQRAQDQQDYGETWGAALAAASRSELPEH